MEIPPPSLRTGLADDVSPPKIDRNSPLGQRLISLVFVLVKRAATTATTYCTHSKRKIVTPEDVQYALKYHAKTFFEEEGFETLEKETLEMEDLVSRFINEDMSSDEVVDTFTEESESDDEEVSDDPGEECHCELCTTIRGVDWDAWDPSDPAENFIKVHVDQVFGKNNLGM